ncbi:MAG: helix-turn-helix transcriptional regulator [Microbacterium sp.]|nr:helix-turn-helix transcriptional regulator [Microbacterium sp.]
MQFTSRDVEQVQATWRQFVPSATLQGVDPTRFRFDWRSAQVGSATLVRYDLEARIRSVAAPEDQILVCRVDAADGGVWSGQRDLDPARPWITDGRQVQARWDHGARVTALVFDREKAQARARALTGADDIVLTVSDLSPRSAQTAAQWERMFAYLDASIGDDTDQLLFAELERHAMLMTLSAFSTSFDEALQSPAQRDPAPRTVRRALAFIDENAHRPITVDDVAAACFISTRGLQYAFRRAIDITPATALRRARLAGAHRELSEAPRRSVTEVARRWGFSHPSRFASAYRDMFGVLPSETVRRARG